MIKKASAFAENFYYKFGIPYTCSYCGDLAETMDHCIPWSVAKRNDNQRRNLIGFCCPACQDCQNILGNRVFSTFQDRVLFVKGKLRNRYGKGHPVWDEEELSELSGNLRKYVEGENYKFNLSRSRILWTNTNEFRKLISEVEEDLRWDPKIPSELKKFFIDDV